MSDQTTADLGTGTDRPEPDPQPTSATTSPAGRSRRKPWEIISYGARARIAVGVLLLVLWEFGTRLFAPPYTARPTDMAPVFFDVLTSREFIDAFLGTMLPIVQGLIFAVGAAVVVGLAMGQIKWIGWSLRGYTNALFALPMVAVVPLVTMWLGYSETARLAVIVVAAYFPMVLNVYDGSRSVSQHYLEVAKTYRAPRWRVWFGVVLPASIPYLLAGFRLASGRALVGAVVAEYIIGGLDGLGFYILVNARSFSHNEAMVAVLALAAVGVAILGGVKWATGRFAPWYDPTQSN